jgi:hypothetical protein
MVLALHKKCTTKCSNLDAFPKEQTTASLWQRRSGDTDGYVKDNTQYWINVISA